MRLTILLLASSALLSGCGSTVIVGFTDADPGIDSGTTPEQDSGADTGNTIDPGDAMTMDAAPSKKYFLMVTQTPPGDAPMNTWGGVARYDLDDDFKPAKMGVGIDASKVADPCGLAFRKRSAELFVGNREGNAGPGSVSRFIYDHMLEKFTPNGTITGNGLSRVHQVTFDPKENELFAANRDGGISRFKFDTNGNPVANGVLTAAGWIRGVAVAPDGKRLYATTASMNIRQFDLSNGGVELTAVQTPDQDANTHFMFVDETKNELYVPAATNGKFYRYKIDANDNLVFVASYPADTPISIALSPSRQELYAAGHVQSDVIDRFKLTNNTTWVENKQLQIVTNWSLGSILMFPSDAVPTPMPW